MLTHVTGRMCMCPPDSKTKVLCVYSICVLSLYIILCVILLVYFMPL